MPIKKTPSQNGMKSNAPRFHPNCRRKSQQPLNARNAGLRQGFAPALCGGKLRLRPRRFQLPALSAEPTSKTHVRFSALSVSMYRHFITADSACQHPACVFVGMMRNDNVVAAPSFSPPLLVTATPGKCYAAYKTVEAGSPRPHYRTPGGTGNPSPTITYWCGDVGGGFPVPFLLSGIL